MSNKSFIKNIVNPYASQSMPEGYDPIGDERNKWVLSGIHDCYISFGFFPKVGRVLTVVENSPLNQQNNQITSDDLKAYLAIYPQNGKYNNDTGEIGSLSQAKIQQKLKDLTRALIPSGAITNYTSRTTPDSQDPENQEFLNVDPKQLTEQQLVDGYTAELIAIPYKIPNYKLEFIRTSFNNPLVSSLDAPLEDIENQNFNPIVMNPEDIDPDDWRNNVPPGAFSSKVYYNVIDGYYYFTKRTSQKSPEFYDIGNVNGQSSNNINVSIRLGVEAILKFSGKFTTNNYERTLEDPEDKILFIPFLDERPNSNWVYAVKVPKEMIDRFDIESNDITIQGGDLSPLEKAQIIIDLNKNNTTKYFTYTYGYIKNNLPKLIETLEHYDSILRLQNLSGGKLNGLNLSKEVDRIKSFPSNIDDYLTISSANISDETLMEFCLDSSFRLNYLFFGGTLYTDNLGKNTFLQLTDSETDNIIKMSAVNVFSNQTSTSLAYLMNMRKILKQILNKQKKDWTSWSQFLPRYTYPNLTIDPQLLKEEEENSKYKFGFSSKKEAPKFFETLADTIRSAPTPSGDPGFASFFEKFVENGKLDLYNSFKTASANCDSDLSNLLKDVDLVFRVLGGKTNTKVLINRAISQLKKELIKRQFDLFQKDSAFREELGLQGDPQSLENYLRRPDIVYSKIEDYIERKLKCLLPFDDIAATLQKQLRQNSVPPEVSQMVMSAVNPPISYRIRKIPHTSNPYEAWLKQLERMVVKFIKQLILGVITQMIEALLGCGPDGNQVSNEQLAERLRLYGFSDLNHYLSDIDFIAASSKAGLENEIIAFKKDPRTENITRVSVVETYPASRDQLLQFHEDVSAILTPGELKSLLDGEAGEKIINLIMEMIYGGVVDIDQLKADYPQAQGIPNEASTDGLLNILSRPFSAVGQKEIKIMMNQYQNSLMTGDVRYASINFTFDKVIAYFKELGRRISRAEYNALTVDPPQNPLEAFCPVPPPIDQLSDEQIKLQLVDQIRSTEEQIKSLCETRDDLFSFDIDAWIAGLGLPNYLKQVLDFLSKLGEFLNGLLAGLYSSDALAMEAPRAGLAKACENFGNTMMARSINKKVLDFGKVSSANVTGGPDRASDLTFWSPQGVPDNPSVFREDFVLRPAAGDTQFEISAERLNELFITDTLRRLEALRRGNDFVDISQAYEMAMEHWNANIRVTQLLQATERTAFNRGSRASDVTEIRQIYSLYEQLGFPSLTSSGQNFGEESLIDRYNEVRRVVENYERFSLREGRTLVAIPDWTLFYRLQDMINLYQHLEEMRTDGVTAQQVADEISQTGRIRTGNEKVFLTTDSNGASIGLGNTTGENSYRIQETLAQASFQNFIEDDPLPEADRTIYENFRTEPYPREGAPTNSPPVTLLGVREANGDPSQKVLDTINTGILSRRREGFAPPLFEGRVTDFLPSLSDNTIQNALQKFLRDNISAKRFVSNPEETVYEHLCKTFFTQTEPNNLTEYMSVINSLPFEETGDQCSNLELSRLMMSSLQVRMKQFFINIVPLDRVYGGFNNPTTLNLLTDYLFRKIKKSFTENKINIIFEENIDELFKLYDKDLSEGPLVYAQISRNTFKSQNDIGENRRQMRLELETYEFKLRYIIKKYLVSVFSKIPQGDPNQKSTAFAANFYNRDVEEDNQLIYPTAVSYQETISLLLSTIRGAEGVVLSAQQSNFLDYCISRLNSDGVSNTELEGLLMIGTYYMPVPPLLAMYMITYDHTVNISGKFYLFKNNERSQKRFDEAIISYVNPNYIPETRFQVPDLKF